MLYARVTIQDGDFKSDVKLVASDKKAYDAWKLDVENVDGLKIVDEFIDEDFGSVTILPEDFEY